MVSELRSENGVVVNLVRKSMFVIYAPGPVTREAVFQRLRLPDAFERRSPDIGDEQIDSL